ncbi:hypothetical protein [Desulfobulbus alkaliphilus]|nr:hypothetical protein [Desulfobulbus alkaliphilus]MBM9538678.1 hypothetical protein [Desulfobulbus alkaliphilus]
MNFNACSTIASFSARIDPACFEVFRPMFEFIKSKCPVGAEGEEVAP